MAAGLARVLVTMRTPPAGRFHIINLIGRLTADPELCRVGERERPVCELRIAVSDGSDRPPLFIDVSTFDKQAEACAKHLAKGRQVAVTGRLTLSEWTARDGSRRYEHSMIGRVEFLAGARERAQAEEREAVAA